MLLKLFTFKLNKMIVISIFLSSSAKMLFEIGEEIPSLIFTFFPSLNDSIPFALLKDSPNP
ncbi:hypothetical protein MtrunA17_Chr2g0312231 [Medicago truncatula]|uniref:Uncharacterized protein n=1 Tax=Medicago truncatula TaxID=3880 RepID=A0A396J8N2_MEDTR|nr:hypothetical protein MtrunA17_Chr2g0312231 [Medicago truncatula]